MAITGSTWSLWGLREKFQIYKKKKKICLENHIFLKFWVNLPMVSATKIYNCHVPPVTARRYRCAQTFEKITVHHFYGTVFLKVWLRHEDPSRTLCRGFEDNQRTVSEPFPKSVLPENIHVPKHLRKSLYITFTGRFSWKCDQGTKTPLERFVEVLKTTKEPFQNHSSIPSFSHPTPFLLPPHSTSPTPIPTSNQLYFCAKLEIRMLLWALQYFFLKGKNY